MTNPTPHGQVPEALQLADALDLYAAGDELQRDIEDAAAELRRLHAENERLAALIEAQQTATHVQKPVGIAHVAGDVSKTGPESNMAQQPAQSAAAPDETAAMNRTRELSESGRWPSDWVEAYRRGYSDRAARAPAESVLEDAARWQWLADYLIGERTDLDEGIVACATIDALRQFADAARKQGANHG